MMQTNRTYPGKRSAKWGWGLLLAVSALLIFNGVAWFFFGPQSVVLPLEEFPEASSTIAPLMSKNARQVAIWYLAFGSLAFLVALEGFRHGTRWAWYASWVQVAALAAVGVLYRTGFGAILLGLVVVALAGQLLAGKDFARRMAS